MDFQKFFDEHLTIERIVGIDNLRLVLLAVLLAPLATAAVCLVVGRRGHRAVRRVASVLAGLHLLVTLVMAVFAVVVATDRSGGLPSTLKPVSTDIVFKPYAVPGDVAINETDPVREVVEGRVVDREERLSAQNHSTRYNLFFVGTAVAGQPPPAIQFFIGLDSLNVWLVLLTSLMTYLAVLVSWKGIEAKAGGYFAWLFVLQTFVIGAFVSFDVILFYVFFELTLIPAFFLIGGWGGGGGRQDAARKFLLYTLFGGLITLVGLVGVVMNNPTPLTPGDAPINQKQLLRDKAGGVIVPTPGPVTFSVPALMKNVKNWSLLHDEMVTHFERVAADKSSAATSARDRQAGNVAALDAEAAAAEARAAAARTDRTRYHTVQCWMFFALVAGFVVKIPIVPFHTWLPAAYAEAPLAVTMLLSAVLAKLGTYGVLRFVLTLCPLPAVEFGLPVFGGLGAVGIVYAAFCAVAQKDIKLMAAYSSVSHLGLLVIGLFAANREGMTGAVLHMINHGLTAGTLFALLAFLQDRYRTTDMTQFGGLWKKFPTYTFLVIIISLAAVGVPGLNNFVSEMMLIGSVFTREGAGVAGYAIGTAAAVGVFLSAWYTISMIRRVFFGPVRTPAAATVAADGTPVEPKDVSGRELIAFGLPAVLCLALGLYPQPLLDSVAADIAVINDKTESAYRTLHPELLDAPPELPPLPPGGPVMIGIGQPVVRPPGPAR